MIYSGSHSKKNALVKSLKIRGFKVQTRTCSKQKCPCDGIHFSISGNNIRENNIYSIKVRELINRYPVIK